MIFTSTVFCIRKRCHVEDRLHIAQCFRPGLRKKSSFNPFILMKIVTTRMCLLSLFCLFVHSLFYFDCNTEAKKIFIRRRWVTCQVPKSCKEILLLSLSQFFNSLVSVLAFASIKTWRFTSNSKDCYSCNLIKCIFFINHLLKKAEKEPINYLHVKISNY